MVLYTSVTPAPQPLLCATTQDHTPLKRGASVHPISGLSPLTLLLPPHLFFSFIKTTNNFFPSNFSPSAFPAFLSFPIPQRSHDLLHHPLFCQSLQCLQPLSFHHTRREIPFLSQSNCPPSRLRHLCCQTLLQETVQPHGQPSRQFMVII